MDLKLPGIVPLHQRQNKSPDGMVAKIRGDVADLQWAIWIGVIRMRSGRLGKLRRMFSPPLVLPPAAMPASIPGDNAASKSNCCGIRASAASARCAVRCRDRFIVQSLIAEHQPQFMEDLGLIGLELNRLAIGRGGIIEKSGFAQGDAEVVMRRRIFRGKLESGPVRLNRLAKFSRFEQDVPEVDVGCGKVGIDSNCFAVGVGGVIKPPLLPQGVSEIRMDAATPGEITIARPIISMARSVRPV